MGTESGRLTPAEMTLLAEAASDATFLGSLDGRTTWVSAGVTDLLGWAPQELVGRPFLDLVHPEDRSLVAGARVEADAGGTGRHRVRVHTQGGDYRWVDILLRTRFDAEGIAAERFGSWHSVDAQVRAEEALAGDVARSRAILDGMLDPWVLLTPVRDGGGAIVDYLFADANARACEYNRVPHDDLVGMRVLDLLPGLESTPVWEAYARVLETGEPVVLEDFAYPQEMFGGAERRYDLQACRVADGLSFTWRDVTERFEANERVRLSEARLWAALESELDPHGFFDAVRDTDGRVVDLRFREVNAAAAAYLGRSRNELVGVLLSSLGTPAFDLMIRALAPVIDTGVPLVRDAFEVTTLKGGPGRFVDLRGVKLGDGVSLMWRDVTDAVRALRALAESEADLRLLLENSGDTVFRSDLAGVFTYLTPNIESLLGWTPSQLLGVDGASLVHPDDLDEVAHTRSRLASGESAAPTVRLRCADGTYRWVAVRAQPLVDDVGAVIGRCGSWRDVSAEVAAQQELADSEEQYRLLSANATEMIALWRGGRCAWASPSTLAFLHATSLEDVIGLEGRSLVMPVDLDRFDEAYAAAEGGQTLLERIRIIGPDGVVHWVEVHAGPYTNGTEEHRGILTSSRVIDELVHAEEELEHQARFDLLTGLLNRHEALQTVTRLSTQRLRTGAHTAVLFCDIDRFKDVNDEYGHAAGDEVLRTLGERLSATIRADDYAARIGGDELLVVLTGVHDLDEAVTIAEKIRRAAAEPIAFEHGVRINPSLSVGVTLARVGESTDALIERADNAMYEAKRTGRDRVVALD